MLKAAITSCLFALSALAFGAAAQSLPASGCGDIGPSVFRNIPDVATHSPAAKEHFKDRLDAFADAPLGCGQIVMLGDSMTELNDWSLFIPASAGIQNRGISGDTSEGVLARLDEIIASRPKAVFLLIGTNDLWIDAPPQQTVANISKAAARIRAGSPDTKVIVQTVFPVRRVSWSKTPNKKVQAINTLLKRESRKERFLLLDTYALLVDRRGKLNAAYTSDGLHLNAAGNAAWSKLVTYALRKHDLLEAGRN